MKLRLLFHQPCSILRLSPAIILLCMGMYASAQQPEVRLSAQFARPSGAGNYSFFDVKSTRDKGFVMVGTDTATIADIKKSTITGSSRNRPWIVKADSSGKLEWINNGNDYVKCEMLNSIQQTPDGGFITSGHGHSADYSDTGVFFIVKLDQHSTVQWSQQLGGTKVEKGYAVINTSDGGYLAAGAASSGDGDVAGNHNPGTDDAWIIKLNAAGSIQWKKCYGGTGWDTAHAVIQTADKGYIIAGSAASGDGDLTNNKGNADGWLIKTDSLGNIIWQKNYGGSSYDVFKSVTLTDDGGIVAAGYTFSNDGDVSGNHGQSDVWAIKTDASGNLVWSKCFGGSGEEYGINLQRTTSNEYLLGGFTESTDGDVKGQNGGADMWMLLLAANGNLVWQKCVGTPNNEYAAAVVPVTASDFAIAGTVQLNSADPYRKYNAGLALLGNANVIQGNAFLDINRNGIKDSGEPNFDQLQINTVKNSITQSTVPYKGQFRLFTDSGSFTTSLLSVSSLFAVVPASHVSSFAGYFNTDSFQVAVQPAFTQPDLTATLLPVNGAARPGFFVRYKLIYANRGTIPVNSGTVSLIKDSRTHFLSASVTPASTSGDTLRWNFATLNPFDSASIIIDVQNSAPPVLNIGDTIHMVAATAYTANDLNPQNDTSRLALVMSGSYDPNDKTETHAGNISTRQLADGDWLNYLVRFQNTGNDTAFSVIVKDTLDSKLDWNSLQVVNSSHPCLLSVKNGNQLAWLFKDIRLPDSNRNELLSHGYIAYRVKPKQSVIAGDIINNKAAIYFDFNLPVITNTSQTTITAARPPTPMVTGLQNSYCIAAGIQKGKISNLPAAGSGIAVRVQLDAMVLPIAADSTFSINLSLAGAGLHNLLVAFSNGVGGDSILTFIRINPAVIPDVNVGANITNVVNLTDPVTITATNAAGGGASPKYIFAKDRLIANILQAESSTGTLIIQPGSLAVGANWVYVRMKTSDTCYTSQFNTDSINIEKTAVTGVTDIDFPNQLINVYPNPFSDIINVSGLNTGKTYTIIISNAVGQRVFSRQVVNANNAVVYKAGLQTGKYWLSLYDYKKHTLIGTLSIIKK